MPKSKAFAAVAVLALAVLAACGGGSDSGGAPADVRAVRVQALDTLRFEPSSVSVRAGEKVRFVVTNAGQATHEFVLGDEEIQMAHQSPGAMDHMKAEALAALTLEPGQTKEATVTFEAAGKVLFGCHVPGHYESGMVGTVTAT